jgi:hypothetical protein
MMTSLAQTMVAEFRPAFNVRCQNEPVSTIQAWVKVKAIQPTASRVRTRMPIDSA